MTRYSHTDAALDTALFIVVSAVLLLVFWLAVDAAESPVPYAVPMEDR